LKVWLEITTGLAVVGDLIGEGAAQERGVVGETPNLATRLQSVAVEVSSGGLEPPPNPAALAPSNYSRL
jgi:hypothetical protein